MSDEKWLAVRATVNLPGVRVGNVVWVDPENEYVASCLDAGFLVPEDEGDEE